MITKGDLELNIYILCSFKARVDVSRNIFCYRHHEKD